MFFLIQVVHRWKRVVSLRREYPSSDLINKDCANLTIFSIILSGRSAVQSPAAEIFFSRKMPGRDVLLYLFRRGQIRDDCPATQDNCSRGMTSNPYILIVSLFDRYGYCFMFKRGSVFGMIFKSALKTKTS